MLNSCKLIAFAATTKPEAARKFYQQTLGLRLIDESPFAIVFDANGTMLRVQIVQEHQPAMHTVVGWQVKDIRKAVAELTAAGVRFERYNGLKQDQSGIWESPAGALIGWFKDPDGNILSLTQFK